MEAVKEIPVSAEKEERSFKSVLFVCTGNTCRSPMAAAWLTHFGADNGIVANSAGLYPAVGAPISANAAAALKAAGIEPSPDNRYDLHSARAVSEELVAAADVVVGISRRHAMELIYLFPSFAGKIVSMPRDVPDPFGGTVDDYIACLAEMEKGIKELFLLDV